MATEPRLVVFGGLPGVGKSTLSVRLARHLGAVHLRIDTIEQAIRKAGTVVASEGYDVAVAVADDALAQGHRVVADAVHPWPVTREPWRDLARRHGLEGVEVEVICSDPAEHRHRVETRVVDIEGLVLPDWQRVLDRDYRPWPEPHLVVDTAGMGPDASFVVLCAQLGV